MKSFLLSNFNLAKVVHGLLCLSLLLCLSNSLIAQIKPTTDTRSPLTTLAGHPNAAEVNFMVDVMATSIGPKAGPNACGNIGFDPAAVRRCVATGSFKVNYTGFTPEAQEAFQYAIDIWSRVLKLSVPIEINAQFAPLGPGILGSAGATTIWRDFANAPLAGTWYPEAIANQYDPSTETGADINASFSSTFGFYFGLDGCPPAGQFDFVTIVMHEIGHGLGFFSSRQVGFIGPTLVGCHGFGTFPYIYDTYLNNSAFGPAVNPLTSLPPGCYSGLAPYFTNGSLTFNGPEAVACNGGPVPLYAPATYAGGSSTSHFDELSFPGVQANSLMTPFVAPGEAVHDPGCTLGLLRDIGYKTSNNSVQECAAPVPTMSQWGLLVFGLLVLNLGLLFIYKQRQILE